MIGKAIAKLCRLASFAPVAQLDSASVFGTEGCRFESCRVYSSHSTNLGLPASS
jgi:hypothetical protein